MLNEKNNQNDDLGSARSLSVIVPILDERDNLETLTEHLAQLGVEQTIIVDGGSQDGSVEWLQQHWLNSQQGHVLFKSEPGRAMQMNIGAKQASSDMLLFLHADSQLEVNAKDEILRVRNQGRLWGRFDIAFQELPNSSVMFNSAMRVIAYFMNLRSRFSGIATGDQAIFVDAKTFSLAGGFEQIPLMEDIALSKALKKYCAPHCASLKVTTSPRRWRQGGVLRTVVQMWYFRLAYFLGVSPQSLAKQYQHYR